MENITRKNIRFPIMHDSYIHACKDVQDNVKEFVINLFINQNVGSADLQNKR